MLDELCDVVNAAIERGGVMLMASFAVGRAQQLIYLLQVLIDQNAFPICRFISTARWSATPRRFIAGSRTSTI